MSSDVDIGTLPIWNDVFQSDLFVSDIGITDVDVGCQILPTLRSMSMPTYGFLTVAEMGLGFLTEFRFVKFSRNGSETSFVISRKKR